jgi:tetracycline repressor-like protein
VKVSTDPADQLPELIRCLVLYVAFRRELSALDHETRSLDPKNRRPYVKKRDQLEAMMVAVLKDGGARGSFVLDDPNMAARALITMCRGIVGWYRHDGKVSPSRLADECVTFALRLVGRQRAAAGPRRRRPSH